MTAADAEVVRQWRAAAPDREVVAVNTTFRLAPWADVLYAMDRKWWQLHLAEVKAGFRGALYSVAPDKKDLDLPIQVLRRPPFEHFNNSGAGAVSLAIMRGAKNIYLLGYDCKRGLKSHWHGDHPKPLANAGSITRWSRFFDRLADYAKAQGVTVVNCSRDTALKCFQQVQLEELCLPRREAA